MKDVVHRPPHGPRHNAVATPKQPTPSDPNPYAFANRNTTVGMGGVGGVGGTAGVHRPVGQAQPSPQHHHQAVAQMYMEAELEVGFQMLVERYV